MKAPRSSTGFVATAPYPCAYLPDRQASILFLDPATAKHSTLYARLASQGFRRSGEHIYSPHCSGCRACVSVRVPVRDFRPRRQQRRSWRANRDLRALTVAPVFKPEHFELYTRYLAARHPGGGMDQPTPEAYMAFLTSGWSDTVFYEFRLAEALLAVAVVDRMEEALSAVYTFFDPDHPSRSLGRFAILYEIEEAKALGLRWLYLGYWIDECKRMRYKNEYQPLEYYRHGRWARSEHPPAS